MFELPQNAVCFRILGVIEFHFLSSHVLHARLPAEPRTHVRPTERFASSTLSSSSLLPINAPVLEPTYHAPVFSSLTSGWYLVG